MEKKDVSDLYKNSLKISQILSGIHFQAPRMKQDDLLSKEPYVQQWNLTSRYDEDFLLY